MSTLGTVTSPTLLSSWQAHGSSDVAGHLAHLGPLPPLSGDFSRRFLADVEAAGLAGKGGAGFPSAVKLTAHAGSHHAGRARTGTGTGVRPGRRAPTLVVNAMEGEPASAKDETLLTCVPHLVLDGAQVAAATIGAAEVVVCVADDRDDLARTVVAALGERSETPSDAVPVTVARTPGRYVGGEESALVGWLAHGRGVPAFRPERGVPLWLGGRPALVHNAETVAHLALLARQAPADTTLVTVSGAVERPGVLEVPVGVPLDEIVNAARPHGTPVASLVGGFGGTWVDAARFATPFGAAALRELGAHPGAGVLVVLAADTCDVAAHAAGRPCRHARRPSVVPLPPTR